MARSRPIGSVVRPWDGGDGEARGPHRRARWPRGQRQPAQSPMPVNAGAGELRCCSSMRTIRTSIRSFKGIGGTGITGVAAATDAVYHAAAERYATYCQPWTSRRPGRLRGSRSKAAAFRRTGSESRQ
jgi:hypothetical protein